MRALAALLVVAAMAAACSTTAGTMAPTTAPSGATRSPDATATPFPSPSMAPATPTTPPPTVAPATQPANEVTPAPTVEAPSPDVSKSREYVRACKSYGYVNAVVILTVKNTGNTWVKLEANSSDYTVYDPSGGVATTGSFSYAYPVYLAPGETGYMADDLSEDGLAVADFSKVDVSAQYTEAAQSDALVLSTSKVRAIRDSYSGEHTITGLITNMSTTDVDDAHVGAFFMDAAGRPIGFAWTNLVENVRAGKTKGFKTVGSTCEPSWGNVKKVVTLAGDDNW